MKHYDVVLAKLEQDLQIAPDFPKETPHVTLAALWHKASGKELSPVEAVNTPLSELNDLEYATLESLIKKRLAGARLSHITGRMHFMGLSLFSDPEVLSARPETELLGETVLAHLNDLPAQTEPIIIDIGCGSGNLTCGIAHASPTARIFSADISSSCVNLTKKNVEALNLSHRVTVATGDLFDPLDSFNLQGTVDIIVSNPPYIPSKKLGTDLAFLTDHEPSFAFDGGPFGFAIHQRIIKEAPGFLKKGGFLIFEFGVSQEKQIELLFIRSKAFRNISFKKDNQDRPRVAIATI